MNRLSTGIAGLDEVLLGGLLAGRVYLLRGQPGAGKTTLALQFLIEGARNGESVLFITLSESEGELRGNAASHGWDLAGVEFLDIQLTTEGVSTESQYSIFHPAEVELVPVVNQIHEALDRLKPTRVVFDSLTQVRLLSRDTLRYRRQVLALKAELLAQGITTILLGESSNQELDTEVTSIVQGVITLSLSKGREGMTRRSVEIEKYRGSSYREGEHPLRIEQGGIRVFPHLLAIEHGKNFDRVSLSSGLPTLDTMLGGGFDRGTCTLITGNAGVGKTTLGLTIIAQAAALSERCALYTFDEGSAELVHRAESVGLKLRGILDSGLLELREINPLFLYPDEFAAWVRVEVEEKGTKVVMIDSLNGYNQSMPDENYLSGHMHQLITYLNRMGVTTFLINEIATLVGDFSITQYGLNYLADTVLVLRYYEYRGAIHRAIGTIKKRLSNHEKTLRSFELTNQGIVIGKTLLGLQGILRGEAIQRDAVVGLGGAPNE